MTNFGYTLMTEQSGPKELVRYAVAAERAGFDFEVMSDHYFPWLIGPGPRAVRLDGAGRRRAGDLARGADDLRDLPDDPLPPGGRRAEGRDAAGARRGPVHPRPRQRREPQRARRRARAGPRSTSGRTCSRRRSRSSGELHTGELVDHRGELLPGRLRPDLGPARARAVDDRRSPSAATGAIERFAPLADHLVAVEPDADARRRPGTASTARPRSAGRRAAIGQIPICWDPDEDAAVARAHEQFRWFAGGWSVNADLPTTAGFAGATPVRPARGRRRAASRAVPTSTRSSRRSRPTGRPGSPTSRSCRSATRARSSSSARPPARCSRSCAPPPPDIWRSMSGSVSPGSTDPDIDGT